MFWHLSQFTTYWQLSHIVFRNKTDLSTCKKKMQNALTFLMKKKSFAPLTNNFWSFKIRIKSYLSEGQKNFFFIRNLRAFCIYFLQVIGISIWGYLPSVSKYPQIFQIKFFPLTMFLVMHLLMLIWTESAWNLLMWIVSIVFQALNRMLKCSP